MDYKIFLKELTGPAFRSLIIILIYLGILISVASPSIVLNVIGCGVSILTTVLILWYSWIEPAYLKAKLEKPKCHWRIEILTQNMFGRLDCYKTECGTSSSRLEETCICGKEVQVDL